MAIECSEMAATYGRATGSNCLVWRPLAIATRDDKATELSVSGALGFRTENLPKSECIRRLSAARQILQTLLGLGDFRYGAGGNPPHGHVRRVHPLEPILAARENVAVHAAINV